MAARSIAHYIGLLGLITCVAGLSWLVKALDPSVTPNVATGARVTASSVQVEAPHDSGQRILDGNVWQTGLQTRHENGPWILLDLGASKRISRVVVYNRVDCCQEEGVPLSIELSEDGNGFRRVAYKNVTFDRWNAEIAPQTARYLRLRLEKSGELHLNEVVVL